MPKPKVVRSLFHQLLLFLGVPLLILWGLSAVASYLNALNAAGQAYDRNLLASARTVAERLVVRHQRLEIDVPYIVLDSFERSMNDPLYYQVIDPNGHTLSGYQDLPDMPPQTKRTTIYPALAHFYDATWREQTLRLVRLYQPINENGVNGIAKIIVAESVQSRRMLAQKLLLLSLFTQGGLVLFTLLLAYLLLHRLLKPMRLLSQLITRRRPEILKPLPDWLPWSETRPLIKAFNRYIKRLRVLISRQARFSADASHQLKTPLMVLNTQLSVALASQQPEQWRESLQGMKITVENTIELTERLLQFSRLKSLEHQSLHQLPRVDIVQIARNACFSRLSQAHSKHIDLGYEGEECPIMIHGEPILLAEMLGNLLDNALKYTPQRGVVTARVLRHAAEIHLEVEDNGTGIDPHLSEQALMPFHRLENASGQSGAGLGLALVQDIARYHATRPQLFPVYPHGLRILIPFPDSQVT